MSGDQGMPSWGEGFQIDGTPLITSSSKVKLVEDFQRVATQNAFHACGISNYLTAMSRSTQKPQVHSVKTKLNHRCSCREMGGNAALTHCVLVSLPSTLNYRGTTHQTDHGLRHDIKTPFSMHTRLVSTHCEHLIIWHNEAARLSGHLTYPGLSPIWGCLTSLWMNTSQLKELCPLSDLAKCKLRLQRAGLGLRVKCISLEDRGCRWLLAGWRRKGHLGKLLISDVPFQGPRGQKPGWADWLFPFYEASLWPSQVRTTKHNLAAGITTLTQTCYPCHQGQPGQKINLWSVTMGSLTGPTLLRKRERANFLFVLKEILPGTCLVKTLNSAHEATWLDLIWLYPLNDRPKQRASEGSPWRVIGRVSFKSRGSNRIPRSPRCNPPARRTVPAGPRGGGGREGAGRWEELDRRCPFQLQQERTPSSGGPGEARGSRVEGDASPSRNADAATSRMRGHTA